MKYQCSECGAEGVKLWRQPSVFLSNIQLKCARCATKGSAIVVDVKGRHRGQFGKTDQLCGLVPAVPSGDTFWGYTSVPEADAQWWTDLPSYASEGK